MNLAFTYHGTVKKKSNLISNYINTKEWLFDDSDKYKNQFRELNEYSKQTHDGNGGHGHVSSDILQPPVPTTSPPRNKTIEEEIKYINMQKQMILDMSTNIIKPSRTLYSMTDLMYLPKSQCNSCRK